MGVIGHQVLAGVSCLRPELAVGDVGQVSFAVDDAGVIDDADRVDDRISG